MEVGGRAPPSTAGDGGRRAVGEPQSGQSGDGLDQDAIIVSKRAPHWHLKS